MSGSTSASESVELVSASVGCGAPFTNAGTILSPQQLHLTSPAANHQHRHDQRRVSRYDVGTVVNKSTVHAGMGHTTTTNGATPGQRRYARRGSRRRDPSAGSRSRGRLRSTASWTRARPVHPEAGRHVRDSPQHRARTGQFAGYTSRASRTRRGTQPTGSRRHGRPARRHHDIAAFRPGRDAVPGATLTSSGGTGAVTWSLPPGSLPRGFVDGGSVAITGTPPRRHDDLHGDAHGLGLARPGGRRSRSRSRSPRRRR